MGDFQLFRCTQNKVEEIKGSSVELEKSLQLLIERHLEIFIGVKFLETEYPTGRVHKGRIDSLGIDENGCPVIIEYKRTLNENVINQGLYYLDWLMDHKAEFELMVLKKFGQNASENIEWENIRLICISGDYTKFDEHAVQQIDRNISLMRYKKFGDDLLMLELVNNVSPSQKPNKTVSTEMTIKKTANKYKYVHEFYEDMPQELKDLYADMKNYILSLGEDVQESTLKFYIAFRRVKNFASIEFRPTNKCILMYIKADVDKISLQPGLTRDVTNIGHLGTGNIEITIKSKSDFESIKYLIQQSYDSN